MYTWSSLSVLVSFLLLSASSWARQLRPCKPIIIIHGILDAAVDMQDLKDNVEKARPGTVVHIIDLYDGYFSLLPLWEQVESVRNATKSIMGTAVDGVNIIAFSQGGILARAIIQTTDDHNVDTFISLSAPLNGQYGDTSYLKWLFPETVKEELYKIFYTPFGQKWSIGNYWKDPHEMEKYRIYSNFLAQLNNESVPDESIFKYSWKKNFVRLKKLILVGGPDDGVITPWQSAMFGCYDSKERVIPMRQLEIYQNDVFGLRSLDEVNSIIECVVPEVKHVKWHGNLRVFNKCIEPYLS